MSLLGESVSNDHDPEQQEFESRIFYGAIFGCLVISALLLLPILYVNMSDAKKEVLALFAIVFGGAALILIEWKLLFKDWFDTGKRLLIHAFFCRDRRGRTQLGRTLQTSLERGNWNGTGLSLMTLLEQQPAAYLFALAAQPELNIPLPTSHSGDLATLLRTQRDCSVRTKIVLIQSEEQYIRAAALEVMPRNLWPRARRKLLRSKYVEARLAAVHSIRDPHTLMRVCRDDPAEPVRLLAWQRLSESLSKNIVLELIESQYTDVRILVLQSGKLPRAQLVKTCKSDEVDKLRALAWDALRERLREAEAVALFDSHFLDTKLCAVESGKLDHARLRKICFQNPDAEVRASAWKQLRKQLTAADAAYLSASLHTDTRMRTVQSGRLPRRRLLHVGLKDDEREIRLATLEQIKIGFTGTEAKSLCRSLDPEFRAYAVQSGLLQPKHIQRLCRSDLSRAVRQVACAKLRS